MVGNPEEARWVYTFLVPGYCCLPSIELPVGRIRCAEVFEPRSVERRRVRLRALHSFATQVRGSSHACPCLLLMGVVVSKDVRSYSGKSSRRHRQKMGSSGEHPHCSHNCSFVDSYNEGGLLAARAASFEHDGKTRGSGNRIFGFAKPRGALQICVGMVHSHKSCKHMGMMTVRQCMIQVCKFDRSLWFTLSMLPIPSKAFQRFARRFSVFKMSLNLGARAHT